MIAPVLVTDAVRLVCSVLLFLLLLESLSWVGTLGTDGNPTPKPLQVIPDARRLLHATLQQEHAPAVEEGAAGSCYRELLSCRRDLVLGNTCQRGRDACAGVGGMLVLAWEGCLPTLPGWDRAFTTAACSEDGALFTMESFPEQGEGFACS